MVDESLNRWIHSRLSLAERLNLQRRDEEADSHVSRISPRPDRCVCCNVRLTPADQFDPMHRCATCRARRRLERRKWRNRG